MRLFAKSLTAVTATGALLLTPIVASATEPVAAYTVDLLAAPGVEASGDAAHPEDWGGDGSVASPGGESDTPRIDQVVESHDEKVKYSVAGYRQARSVAQSEDTEPTDTNSDDAIEPSRDGGYELLTAALKTEEFQVAGVIWTGAAPERIDVRSYVGGEWSEWYMLDFETAPKGAASESERVAGTEPYMSAGATGIQARATGTVLPDTFELQLMTGETTDGIVEELAAEVAERQPEEGSHNDAAPIADGLAEEIKNNVAQNPEQNPGQNPEQNPERDTAEQATGNNASVQSVSGEDAQVVTSPAAYKTNSKTSATVPAGISVPAAALRTVPTAVTRPAIYARAYWGGPSTSTWKPQYYKLKGAVIHHTAGTNYYTRAQSAGIVKGIWSYHAKSLGWGDVGYNFLIDKYGQVFEGRLGSLNAPAGKMVEGGHALGANTYTVGLSVLGNYYGASNPNPSAESITAIENVLAWQFSLAGLNPNGTWYNANAVAGFPKTIGTIVGHKDTSATGCPGKIYDRIPAIRTAVKNKISTGSVTLPLGSTPAMLSAVSGSTWMRLAGVDRYATSAAISHKQATKTGGRIYVASGENYPDGLAAGAVAGLDKSPLLLVGKNHIASAIAAEVTRLKPTSIVIVGGYSVISSDVERSLSSLAPSAKVDRLGGVDRYATAAQVARSTSQSRTVFLVNGGSFPDALAAGSAASRQAGSILLTDSKSLSRSAKAVLSEKKPSHVYIIGGTGVVSDSVAVAVRSLLPKAAVTRVSGADRYETASNIAAKFWSEGAANVYTASGLNYPDALSGVPAAAVSNAPILLIEKSCSPAVTANRYRSLKPSRMVVLGGLGVNPGTMNVCS